MVVGEGIMLRPGRIGWSWLFALGVVALLGWFWLRDPVGSCVDAGWASGVSLGEDDDSGPALIAYRRYYGDRDAGLLVVNTSSGDVQELIRGDFGSELAWSPDGAHIAFTFKPSPWDKQLMVMDRDGANQKKLTGDDVLVGGAMAWSPDGSELAFSGGFVGSETGGIGVLVTDRNGTDVRELVGGFDVVDDLAWSPDGRHIAFGGWMRNLEDTKGVSSGGGSLVNVNLVAVTSFIPLDVFVMEADGTNLRELTGGRNPEWSPDGGRILFSSIAIGPFGVVELETGSIRRLTQDLPGFAERVCPSGHCTLDTFDPTEVRFGAARWSPDGEHILFSADRDGDSDLFLMNAAGATCQLTDNYSQDWYAAWSPDGSRIAFSSDRDGEFQIYVMNADGTAVTKVSDGDGFVSNLVWSRGKAG